LRVAYVTQWFPPEPAPLALWIAQALRDSGCDVHVVTGVPNYPTGVVHAGYDANRPSRDTVDGFRVSRMPLYPDHGTAALGRALNYLSFAASSSLHASAVLRSADVALVYGSPVTAAVAPYLHRTPYVVLAQDLWPDSVFATGYLTGGPAAGAVRSAAGAASQHLYRHAAHVAAITPGMRDALVERGIPAGQTSVVYNWVDEDMVRPSPPDPTLRADLGLTEADFVVLYAGTMGPAQDLGTLVDAISLLADRPDVHLVLVGDGTELPALRSRASEASLDRVHVLPPVPIERIPGLVAAADLNVVSLADDDLFRMTLPSKVQTLLACGAPVLGILTGDAAEVVSSSGAGLVARPGDAADVAARVREAATMGRAALQARGASGREYYDRMLSKRRNAAALTHLLRAAARLEGHRP
jgi:glycosyltransferase involved in cell wall biosynthesis